MLAMVIIARVAARAHVPGVPMRCRFTGAMHLARNSRRRRAAQHRDPRREKNEDEVGGENAANAAQGEVPVRNPVTTRTRNPRPSSSTADRRSVAVPSSLTKRGCTLRKL